MLNHLTKVLFVFISSLLLVACHKAPVLNNELALNLLNRTPSGYTVSIVTNNPNARGAEARGWSCADKAALIRSGVVSCNESGKSGDYLTFTNKGESLLVGKPWGDDILSNANVLAVSRSIQAISSIEKVGELHAVIHYTWVYDQHTPFSNAQLKKIIALNVSQSGQASVSLNSNEWSIDD